MAKKTSGLGRGLGDLLEDNTPEIRSGGSVVRQKTEEDVQPTLNPVATPTPNLYTNIPPKSLYEEKHKNKSLKANFRKFNR